MNETRQDRQASRGVLLCSAAFFALCALCSALLGRGLWPALLVCCCAACLLAALALMAWHGRYRAAALGLALGLLCCGAHALLRWAPAWALADRVGVCRVAVSEEAVGYGGYGVVWGRLLEADGAKAGFPVKLYVQDGSPHYQPGDLLTVEGLLRKAPAEPGAGLVQRGVFLTLRQTGSLTVEDNGAATVLTRLRRLCAAIRENIGRMLPGEEGALLTALLTGDDRDCSDGLLAALSATGLRHIISVSGLHLSVLAGFLIKILGRRTGVFLALPVVFTYAALVGFPASAVRAAVMQGFVLLAFLLKRDNDSPTALGAAGLVLCAFNPGASLSAGLLLSFAATGGILWAAGPVSARLTARKPKNPLLARLQRYGANTLAVSLAATACTLPITLLYFGSASLLSLPLNLLCLWAVSLSLLLGVGALCLTAVLPAAAPVCGWLLQWPLRYLTGLVSAVGSQPWATGRASLYWALAAGALLLTVALLRRGRGRWAACCLGLLCLCVGLSALESRLVTRVAVGDGGGGPVIALRSGGQTAYIGGGASDYAAGTFIRAEQARAGRGDSAFLLLCGGDWRQTGGAGEALRAAGAPAVTLPEGVFFQSDDSAPALCYTEGGSLSLGGLTVTLLPAGDACLCGVTGRGLSLLSLCGTEPWAAVSALAETPAAAEVLVLDERWVDAPAALGRVCALTGARALVLADGGFAPPPLRLCTLPVLALTDCGTVTLETVR